MRRVIVKEGPLVFLRDVVIMEILAFGFLYGASFLANYEQLYHSYTVSHYLRYDLFLFGVSALFELFYIALLFLNWYFSHYEITDSEITKKSGLLFRHRKSVNLSEVASVEVYQSPFSRMMRHATIILEHANGRVTKIRNVGDYKEYVHVIKTMAKASGAHISTLNIKDMIERGEDEHTEFKETMRYDVRKNETSKEVEKMVVKSIVGFLNGNGGTLVIGVDDECVVKGLERDVKTLPKKNKDSFENHLVMLVRTMIGLQYTKYLSTRFEKIDGKEICLVTVRMGHKPAYIHNGDKHEDFFVRVGNSTQPFSMSEAEEYIKTRF